MMNDLFKPPGAPGPFGQDCGAGPFSEHLALAARGTTPEPPDEEPQAHAAPHARQIGRLAEVVALHTVRSFTKQRAECRKGVATGANNQNVLAAVYAVHREPGRVSDAKPTEPP